MKRRPDTYLIHALGASQAIAFDPPTVSKGGRGESHVPRPHDGVSVMPQLRTPRLPTFGPRPGRACRMVVIVAV